MPTTIASPPSDDPDYTNQIARILSLAEKVFGDQEKADRWLRKPKYRFGRRSPMDMMHTENGAKVIEEMLLQLHHGIGM